MPLAVIERAMALLPDVDFVNAYGLTETSSTIALLGPDDHREAFVVGRPSGPGPTRFGRTSAAHPRGVDPRPTRCRGPRGHHRRDLGARRAGLGRVPGARTAPLRTSWFHTRDAVHLDDDGYLYVHGRLDDVIVRGGENLSPGEIESVLLEHEAVEEAAVVGIPDTEWGERVVAAVVPVPGGSVDEEELREHVRQQLRSTKTPERIDVLPELPFNETGKLLRRTLRSDLAESFT